MIIIINRKKLYTIIALICVLTLGITITKNKVNGLTPTSSNTSNITIEKIQIMSQDDKVELYPLIEVEFSKILSFGQININNIQGSTQLEGNKLTYIPKEILQPNTQYTIDILAKGINDADYIKEIKNITTQSLSKDEIWVEVALGSNPQTVYIRKENEIIKEMICSGGIEQEPSIIGTYYLQNRGDEFYSERFKEGAKYWVRIKDQYLFHSIPRDKEWNIIKEELEKLGEPASHGCIRLSDEDAKWFYENIPDETMIIIHEI
ncbi:L,D-transpeptidase-like protein [Natranaerovirga hydrolytica]|uniref:L,D-transpeptidase-like protein n=1 Tax=Natranaerovirga hydrolytica TaxID=680378 RepID=A0A4R1M9G6_9FIRM|nr:L,D-transpeptidase family protein [Natranaerovirga hydrolytica]TCK89018.1 L,D-transpeptidase-like protein [Natranaerovirga hydrolytica]